MTKAFANNIMLNLKSKYKAEFDTEHMQAVYVHIQKARRKHDPASLYERTMGDCVLTFVCLQCFRRSRLTLTVLFFGLL